ncbi:hypothetical protein EV384_5574 [Micromonospora kangleipakensis]|uniref:Aldolase n=1 Tax=Micromonospora kangleipakensis TaxID=1077942 RepID=A0A4Q8BFW4_9ACTN|nr:hypothetical protein [Micromonospora kangleipakensis]RZU76872.1 hypothetical protein EV384_5574 [Micromonospora kangleipakensis]
MNYRLNRLFNPASGRCLDVAVDHGFFGEPSFLTGIEDMPAAIETLVAAAPDAIQLTPGLAPLLQSRRCRPGCAGLVAARAKTGTQIRVEPGESRSSALTLTVTADGNGRRD